MNLTVGSLATCTVKPDCIYLSIFCQKFSQLVHIVIIILYSFSVAIVISVPRRKVNSEFKSEFFAGFCRFSYNITFSVLIRRILYAMLRIFGRPQTKTVMMFTGKNQSLHSGIRRSLCPLSCIKLCRIKNGLRLFSVPPFAPCKSINSKMYKAKKLHTLIKKLPFARHRFYQSFIFFYSAITHYDSPLNVSIFCVNYYLS